MRLKFKMLTIKVSQIRSEDWFVTIDLKDAYFYISILSQHWKFLRFAFGDKAYLYRVLPFSLALSPHTFTKGPWGEGPLWGSWLILLEVWRPPRPSHLVYRCTIFVTLRDCLPLWPLSSSTTLTLRPLLALQFFLPKLCRSTRGRDLSVWWRGQFHSQSVLRRSVSFPKGNVPGYASNHGSLREQDAASLPYFLHPCERLLPFEAATIFNAGAFILPGRYIISADDVSRDSLRRSTHICQSVGTQGYSQSVLPYGRVAYQWPSPTKHLAQFWGWIFNISTSISVKSI